MLGWAFKTKYDKDLLVFYKYVIPHVLEYFVSVLLYH